MPPQSHVFVFNPWPGTFFHSLRRREDGSLTITGVLVVYRHGFEHIFVLLIVSVTKEAEGILVIGNALHRHVVIFAGRVVTAAGAILAYNSLCEVVISAGLNSGPVKAYLLVRSLRSYLGSIW